MKRILGVFVCAIMVVSSVFVANFSASAEIINGFCGADDEKSVAYSYDTQNGVLTITGSGAMEDMTEDKSYPWSFNQNYSNLQIVIIKDGITKIGNYSFNNCISLKNIDLPENITSINTDTFYQCKSLENIIIPNTVTTVCYEAFGECTALKSVTLSDSLIDIDDYSFYGCTSLEYIEIPENTAKIGNSAFRECSQLEKITITDKVLCIGESAFEDCVGLKTASMSDSTKNIGERAFAGCVNLKRLTIPKTALNLNDNIIYDCAALKDIDFTGTKNEWNENNSDFSNVIIHCTDGVIGNENEIEYDNVVYTLYNDYTATVSGYVNEFEEVNIPGVIKYGISDFNVVTVENLSKNKNLKSVSIPKSVTAIDSRAFSACNKLSDIYYDGTLEEWNNIKYSTKVTVHCSDGILNKKEETEQTTSASESTTAITEASASQETAVTSQPEDITSSSVQTQTQQNSVCASTEPMKEAKTNLYDNISQANTERVSNNVVPLKKAKIKKLKRSKNSIILEWKKVSGVKGYQVQAATDKKFKKNKKSVTVKKSKTTKTTIKKLKSNKKYYVRIRTYKTVDGKKVYSKWSKVKTVKTK